MRQLVHILLAAFTRNGVHHTFVCVCMSLLGDLTFISSFLSVLWDALAVHVSKTHHKIKWEEANILTREEHLGRQGGLSANE